MQMHVKVLLKKNGENVPNSIDLGIREVLFSDRGHTFCAHYNEMEPPEEAKLYQKAPLCIEGFRFPESGFIPILDTASEEYGDYRPALGLSLSVEGGFLNSYYHGRRGFERVYPGGPLKATFECTLVGFSGGLDETGKKK